MKKNTITYSEEWDLELRGCSVGDKHLYLRLRNYNFHTPHPSMVVYSVSVPLGEFTRMMFPTTVKLSMYDPTFPGHYMTEVLVDGTKCLGPLGDYLNSYPLGTLRSTHMGILTECEFKYMDEFKEYRMRGRDLFDNVITAPKCHFMLETPRWIDIYCYDPERKQGQPQGKWTNYRVWGDTSNVYGVDSIVHRMKATGLSNDPIVTEAYLNALDRKAPLIPLNFSKELIEAFNDKSIYGNAENIDVSIAKADADIPKKDKPIKMQIYSMLDEKTTARINRASQRNNTKHLLRLIANSAICTPMLHGLVADGRKLYVMFSAPLNEGDPITFTIRQYFGDGPYQHKPITQSFAKGSALYVYAKALLDGVNAKDMMVCQQFFKLEVQWTTPKELGENDYTKWDNGNIYWLWSRDLNQIVDQLSGEEYRALEALSGQSHDAKMKEWEYERDMIAKYKKSADAHEINFIRYANVNTEGHEETIRAAVVAHWEEYRDNKVPSVSVYAELDGTRTEVGVIMFAPITQSYIPK